MNLNEASNLIAPAFQDERIQVWADLGCGTGLFTSALLSHLNAGSQIYAVDQNTDQFEFQYISDHRKNEIILRSGDMVDFKSPQFLYGILMANSIHFVVDKLRLIKNLKTFLRPNGQLLIIEYDTDRANPWVPYPLKLDAMKDILREGGCDHIEVLGYHPSRYLGRMYCLSAKFK